MNLFRRRKSGVAKTEVRAHHVPEMFDGSSMFGYTRKHTRLAIGFREKVKQSERVKIVKSPDEICRVCPINPESPEYTGQNGLCDQKGIRRLDRRKYKELKATAKELGIRTFPEVSIDELERIVRRVENY